MSMDIAYKCRYCGQFAEIGGAGQVMSHTKDGIMPCSGEDETITCKICGKGDVSLIFRSPTNSILGGLHDKIINPHADNRLSNDDATASMCPASGQWLAEVECYPEKFLSRLTGFDFNKIPRISKEEVIAAGGYMAGEY